MNGQPPRIRKPMPPQGLSKESRFIGYLVLGFGILAVVTVLIIAMGGKSSTSTPESVKPETLVEDMVNTPTTAPPIPQKELIIPRDPDVSVSDMQGTWQAQIGKYVAVLQFQKGVYQVILAQPDPNAARLYTSGMYKQLEDIFMLTPRLDWPQPVSPKEKKISYDVLTRAPFPILASFEKGKMIWQNPPQSEKRVLVPFKSPLLVNEDARYIVWDKLD